MLICGAFYDIAKTFTLTCHVGTAAAASFDVRITNAAVGTSTVGARIRASLNYAFDRLAECL
jgi:hypothetical protein